MEGWLQTALGVVAGGAIAWLGSWFASRELRTETAKLRSLHELTLYCLLNPKANITPKYDEKGAVVGLIVSAVGRA